MTVDEVVAVVQEWGRLEAAREKRALYRTAALMATLVNLHRKPGTAPLTPEDFLTGPDRYMTAEEGQAFMQQWAASMNAAHGRRRKKPPADQEKTA